NLPQATARRWSPHPSCSRRCRQTRRRGQMEGALKGVFQGIRKLSVRCVVTSGKPGPGHRLPFVGPEPSYRTRPEEHALPIVRVHVDLYTRQPDNRWLLASANRLEDSLDPQSVGCRLALADLYERVDLPERALR